MKNRIYSGPVVKGLNHALEDDMYVADLRFSVEKL